MNCCKMTLFYKNVHISDFFNFRFMDLFTGTNKQASFPSMKDNTTFLCVTTYRMKSYFHSSYTTAGIRCFILFFDTFEFGFWKLVGNTILCKWINNGKNPKTQTSMYRLFSCIQMHYIVVTQRDSGKEDQNLSFSNGISHTIFEYSSKDRIYCTVGSFFKVFLGKTHNPQKMYGPFLTANSPSIHVSSNDSRKRKHWQNESTDETIENRCGKRSEIWNRRNRMDLPLFTILRFNNRSFLCFCELSKSVGIWDGSGFQE